MYSAINYKCNRETNWQGLIQLRTWDNEGKSIVKSFPHSTDLYFENETGEYTGVYGNALSKMTFDNIFEKRRWKKDYNVNRTYGDFPPEIEFLQDTFFKMNKEPEFYENQLRTQVIDIETSVKPDGKDPFDVRDTNYPINLISIYDSKTDCVYVFMHTDSKWYNKPKAEHPWKNSSKVKYFVFEENYKMLQCFMVWWHKNTPDVITGWNIKRFDIPYIMCELYKRFDLEDDENYVATMLSPFANIIEREVKSNYGGFDLTYQICGVSILDYKDLYMAYGKASMPNFKLETICQEELGVGKLEYEGSIHRFYTEEWEKFVEYNIIDVERVWQLEQKLKFIELAKTVAYESLIPLEKVLVTTPVVIGALNQEVKLIDRIMITSTGVEDVGHEYQGGFVKAPQTGIYSEGIFSVDLNSLYPNIIITLNLSNETYLGKIIEETDSTVTININGNIKDISRTQFNKKIKPRVNRAFNDALFLKPAEKQGFIPSFLDKLYTTRRATKNKMLETDRNISKLKAALSDITDKEKRKEIRNAIEVLDQQSKQLNAVQHAAKIRMNSLYGLFANPYSPIFNLVLAEAITLTGQDIVKSSADFIDEYAKEVLGIDYLATIYADTDSCYVNAEPFLKKNFGEKLKWTKSSVQEYCDYLDAEVVPAINANCTCIVKEHYWSDFSAIEFKRETLCSHGAFVAKKRYCLLVRNDEGTPVKKWKYVGLDVKKNEYTKRTKAVISTLIETMILEHWDNSKFSENIYAAWEDFQTWPVEDIAIIKGYNTPKEYYGGFRSEKGTTVAARGVHYHNDLIKRLGMADVPELQCGEKLQFVYLVPNNEYQINVIGFDFKYPKSFIPIFEVDKKTMFDKTILKPLQKFIEMNQYVLPNVDQRELFDINDL